MAKWILNVLLCFLFAIALGSQLAYAQSYVPRRNANNLVDIVARKHAARQAGAAQHLPDFMHKRQVLAKAKKNRAEVPRDEEKDPNADDIEIDAED